MTKYFSASFFALSLVFVAGCGHTADAPPSVEQLREVSASVSDRPAQVTPEKKAEMTVEEVAMAKRFDGGGSAALIDVTDDGTATGSAQLAFIDGATEHYVNAKNLPALENGFFYEGWLVRAPVAGGFFSTGEMLYDEERDTWILDYTGEGDQTDHPTVVITLEPRDDDPAPAAHILEGRITFDDTQELQ